MICHVQHIIWRTSVGVPRGQCIKMEVVRWWLSCFYAIGMLDMEMVQVTPLRRTLVLSARACGSNSLLEQNPPVLNWWCRLTQVDLYSGHKMVVVAYWCCICIIIIIMRTYRGWAVPSRIMLIMSSSSRHCVSFVRKRKCQCVLTHMAVLTGNCHIVG